MRRRRSGESEGIRVFVYTFSVVHRHMVRASLNYVNWKERKLVAADLKMICRAVNEREAAEELAEFSARWGSKY